MIAIGNENPNFGDHPKDYRASIKNLEIKVAFLLGKVVQSLLIYGCQSNSAFLHHDPKDNSPSHSKHLLLIMKIKPLVFAFEG